MLSALLGERPLNPDSAPAPDAHSRGTEAVAGRAHAPPECDDTALAIRILLATAVRSAELYQAKWADVDLDGAQWHIPKSKTGAAMDIPLAPMVVDWYRELRALAGNSAFVLPAHSRSRAARHGGDTHLNKDTLREAIAHWLRTAKPAVRRFTPHDLRSTVKSHLRALGVPRDISEMCLNHKLSGVEGIYDRHTYFEERREALGKWAGVLALMKLTSSHARGQSVAAASPAA
jgi:integrase